MAEKSLKALLIFFDLELEKTHDLKKLSSLLKEYAHEIDMMKEETSLLNRYYIETRYVGDFSEFSWDDAEKAYESATKIKRFVLDKIN